MTPNTDLICRVLAHIETHPASWNQEIWMATVSNGGTECGTAACFAGWACLLTGEKLVGHDSDVRTKSGDVYVWNAGARLLGLSDEVTGSCSPLPGQLFHSENTLDDLYSILAPHLGTEPEVLRDKVRDYL